MAVSPTDVSLSSDELQGAKNLEILLDKLLEDNFAGEGVPISFQYAGLFGCSDRIRNEVIRRYKAAGWTQVGFRPSSETWTFVAK